MAARRRLIDAAQRLLVTICHKQRDRVPGPTPLVRPAAGDRRLPALRPLGPGTLRRRGARGRHRGTPQRGQDDPLQRAHEGGRRDHRVRVPDGQVERRHGDDRRRAARAARRARRREEGDARRRSGAGRSRHRPRAPRRPAPGRRAARRRGRVLRHRRSRERHRDARSSSCSSPTPITSRSGSSGSRSRRSRATPRVRKEAEVLREVLAHLEAGKPLTEWTGELPDELDPLTTKPLIAIVNGPGGIDCKLEAELAELSDEEAAAFREGASALDEVVAAAQGRARPDHVLHRGREGDAGVDAARRPDGARGGRHDPLRHRARVHPLRGDPLGRPARRRLARRGVEARHAAARGQDLRRAGRRRAQHPLQRLTAVARRPVQPAAISAAPPSAISPPAVRVVPSRSCRTARASRIVVIG